MDPLSMTASIVAILDVTAKFTSYLNDVAHARVEQRKLVAEISQLHGLLTSLRYRVEAASAGDAWYNQVKLLAQENGPFDQFREALEAILKRLPSQEKREQLKTALIWTWHKKHTDEMLQRIERIKTLVLCALAEDMLTLMQLVHEDTKNLDKQVKQLDLRTAELQLRSNQDLQHRIAQWLGIPDPCTNYHAALNRRQSNTGRWLLDGKDFFEWQNKHSALMWLHGSAGCGKTVLSAAALQTLLRLQDADPNIAVAYFYFDFNDTRKQRVDKMIRSILFQIAQQTSDGQQALRHLYERCKNGQQQSPQDTIQELLCKTVGTVGSTYIVLDALDECTERDDLLDFLKSLVQLKLTGLRILATSRREWDIEEPLRSVSDFNINIQSAIVDADIRTYIEARLITDPKLKKWPDPVHAEILEKLMEKADGMFRWAYCQLESIRQCVRLQKLREALKSLPKTLDETYERMLQHLESRGHLSDALTVLRWLCYSDRPLSLPEVVEILAIDTIDGTGFSLDERLPEPMEIMVICSSLVTTYCEEEIAEDDSSSQGSINSYQTTNSDIMMVRLAHYSVKEYLLAARCAYGSEFDAHLCHQYISEASLHYLLSVTEQGSLDETVITKYPLAQHVAKHWWHHAHNMGEGFTQNIISLALRLSSSGNTPLLYCIQLYNPDQSWKGVDTSLALSDIAPLLYYTALAGVVDVVRALVDKGSDVNAQGGGYGNALQAASAGGHEAVVRMLLDAGADVNAQGGGDGNALQAASAGGHEAVVRMLLDAGADVNAQGGGGRQRAAGGISRRPRGGGADAAGRGGGRQRPRGAVRQRAAGGISRRPRGGGADAAGRGGRRFRQLQINR